MVTATTVEADPIGVMFPPRLDLNITLHQNLGVWLYPVSGRVFKIFPSMADSGMLPVTALVIPEAHRIVVPPPRVPKLVSIVIPPPIQHFRVFHNINDYKKGHKKNNQVPEQ